MPRIVDTDARRDEICRAVWAVIARDGIEAVTLRAVARTAGVSVGRIQHYYPSREEMLRDSCRRILDLAATVADDTRGTVAARLSRCLHAQIPTTPQFATGVTVWLSFVTQGASAPGIAELVRHGHEAGVAAIADLLRDLGSPHPEQTALHLQALTEGLALRVTAGSLSPDAATAALDAALAALTR